MGLSKPCRLTCVLGHVVLELVDPFALVATVRAQVFPFLLMDPHMVLKEGRAKNMPRKMWVLQDKGRRQKDYWKKILFPTPILSILPLPTRFPSLATLTPT